MDHAQIEVYCLQKKGAYVDHPFGPDSDIIKVKGRIFAQLFYLRAVPMLTVNGQAFQNDFYRNLYPQWIRRGYHCPPVQQPYFNTIDLTGDVPEELLLEMLDRSYCYAVGKLTKRKRQELEEE